MHLAEVMDSVGAQRCICKNCYRAPTAERKSKLFKRLAMCAFINIICYFPTVGPRSPTVCVYASTVLPILIIIIAYYLGTVLRAVLKLTTSTCRNPPSPPDE